MITKKEEEVMENINEVDTDEDFSGIPEKKVSTPDPVKITKSVSEWQEGKVSTPNGMAVNLRSDPDKRGTVLTQIPNGTKVSVKIFDIKWYAVKFNSFEGFCMREFIKIN